MRLHRLQMTAFGPFADTVDIDFGALSEQGLFLLTGPTGAGKTTVLDGVCFALFGRVPGERQSAAHLRSDHAADGVPPRVVLEATLGGRRIRIERSPAWQRPKKRGSGTTSEKARTVLQEQREGTWTPVTHRADEAGDHLGALLGMTLDQFLQVVLLPQGDFATFLTADAPERQRLLERLFRTQVYREVEIRLADMRRTAATVDREHRDRVADALSRLLEAADVEQPALLDDDLAEAVDSGALSDWLHEQRVELADVAAVQQTRSDEMRGRAERAEQRAMAAHEETRRRLRGLDARRRLDDLDRVEREESAAGVPATERLSRADRAAAVRPLATVAAEAEADQRTTEQAITSVLDRLVAIMPEMATTPRPDVAVLTAAREAAQEAELTARSLVAAQADRVRAVARRDALRAELAGRRTEHAHLDTLVREAPERLEALTSAIAAEQGRVEAGAEADLAIEQIRSRLEARLRLTSLTATLRGIEARLEEADRARLRAAEHARAVREQRVADMAAELARGLAVGDDCPVCGSSAHPHPASPGADHVDAAAEELARDQVADAEIVWTTLRDEQHNLQVLRERASQQAGDLGEDALQALIATHREHQAQAREADRRLGPLRVEHESLAARVREATVRSGTLAAEIAGDEARLSEVEDEIADLSARLASLLGDPASQPVGDPAADDGSDPGSPAPDADPAGIARLHARRRDLLDQARDLLGRSEEARLRLRRERQRLDDAAAEAGFSSTEAALAAVLDDRERAALRDLVAARAAERARCGDILDDPEVATALTTEAADVDALERESATLAATSAELERTARRARERADRVATLTDRVLHQLRAWEPDRRRLVVVSALAATADGRGEHNALRISLSSYVLAERLRQVIDAANERLARMLPRYLLEHSEERTGRDRRGGLGLLVLDQWSGQHRPAGTLSGGETFVVSLALALGLADVVTAESGAVDIGTLFVDEGFGSLDARTLDDVLDVLDVLREGGRVVGVVSHVAEMRERIPAQVRVTPQTRGSTVEVSTG